MTSADMELKRRAFLLFKEVVELDADAREKRLLEACAGNIELRTQVDALLAAFGTREYSALAASLPRALLKELINEYLEECRQGIKDGKIKDAAKLGLAALMPGLAAYVRDQGRPHFRRVLNATGVVIHTNLGRSLLAPEAVRAVSEACGSRSIARTRYPLRANRCARCAEEVVLPLPPLKFITPMI